LSQKANYFKLGLFVIGALISGVVVLLVIGSGRWFERKITIETYFNESVQGLDLGSKIKFKGVVIGEVTKISFTYVVYQQDLPTLQRARYVLVESQIQPRLVGGRAAAGDLTDPANAKMEVERGLRIRLTPQGITGTSYLELDYVDPPPPPLPVAWTPNNVYIPSAPSTVAQFVNAASEIIDRLHKLDIEGTLANLNKLMLTTNDRLAAIDTKGLSDRATKTLDRVDQTLANLDTKKISTEGPRCSASFARPTTSSRRCSRTRRGRSCPRTRRRPSSRCASSCPIPKLQSTVNRPRAHDVARRPDPRRRRDGPRVDDRQPARDHRQPARPHRGREALSVEPAVRRAPEAAAAEPAMNRLSASAIVVALAASIASCSLTRPTPVKQMFLIERRRRGRGDAARARSPRASAR
jgi:hypothetical protein